MGCLMGDDWKEHQRATHSSQLCTADEAESKAHPDRLEDRCDANAMSSGHRVCSVSAAGAHPLGTMWICDCAPACRSPPPRLSLSPLLENDGGMTVLGERERGGAAAIARTSSSPTTFGFGALDQTQPSTPNTSTNSSPHYSLFLALPSWPRAGAKCSLFAASGLRPSRVMFRTKGVEGGREVERLCGDWEVACPL